MPPGWLFCRIRGLSGCEGLSPPGRGWSLRRRRLRCQSCSRVSRCLRSWAGAVLIATARPGRRALVAVRSTFLTYAGELTAVRARGVRRRRQPESAASTPGDVARLGDPRSARVARRARCRRSWSACALVGRLVLAGRARSLCRWRRANTVAGLRSLVDTASYEMLPCSAGSRRPVSTAPMVAVARGDFLTVTPRTRLGRRVGRAGGHGAR